MGVGSAWGTHVTFQSQKLEELAVREVVVTAAGETVPRCCARWKWSLVIFQKCT